MPSQYPTNLDVFNFTKLNTTNLFDDHPLHHNDLADAINRIQAELGRNPSGGFTDVTERFQMLGSSGSGSGNWINVKDAVYGAVGDGSTDDTSAIQAAINAVPNSGGTVFFPPGIYIVSSTLSLSLKTNITVAGAGWGSVLKLAPVAGTTYIFQPQNTTLRPTIRDLTFDGNNSVSGRLGRALFASANGFSQYGQLLNCRIINFDADGSPAGGAIGFSAKYWKVKDCHIENCVAQPVNLNAASEFVSVSGCYIKGLGNAGVFDGISNQGQSHYFLNNKLEAHGDTGINMAGDGHICIGNEIWLSGNSALNTGGGHNLILIGNSCYANGRKTGSPRSNAGIRVREHTSNLIVSQHCVILGNRCYEDVAKFPLPSGALGQRYGIEIVNEINTAAGNPSNNLIFGNSLQGNLTDNLAELDVGTGNAIFANQGAPGLPAVGERDANSALTWLLSLLDGMGIVDDQTTAGTGSSGGGVNVISGAPTGGADGDLNVDEANDALWYRSNGVHRQLVDATKLVSMEELQQSVVVGSTISTSNSQVPVMVAKFPLKIVSASLIHYNEITSGGTSGAIIADNTNYWTVSVRRMRADVPATIATKTTQATGGEGVTKRTDWNFDAVTFNTTNQILQAGDGVDFAFVKTNAATNWGACLALTVRYEPL